MSYRELQAQAKRLGLKATGTKAALLERIGQHRSEAAAAAVATGSPRRTGPKSFKAALARQQKQKATKSQAEASSSPKKKRRKTSAPKSSASLPSEPSSSVERSDIAELVKLTRQKIESCYNISGKKGKEGTTFIATGKSGAQYAIKMFAEIIKCNI